MKNKVSSNEVKRHFLLADAGKESFNDGEKTIYQLEEKYKRIFDQIFSLKDEEVNERIRDKVRLERYDSLDWYRGLVNLEDIGPYPKMKGLDARLTVGNVPETALEIERVKNGNRILDYGDIEEKAKREEKFQKLLTRSESFQRNLSFIYERFFPILLPSGMIRGEYNDWVRTEKLNLPLCKILNYDADDGSERLVNYALAGRESSECFYAIPRPKRA